MKNSIKAIIGIFVIALIVLYSSAYIVDETEQVVITQFGKVIGKPITEPGLKLKMPFLQKTNYFPKNLLEWDGDPGQVPTKDKTYIWVDSFARWKIVDPVRFFQSVNNIYAAIERLDDIIDPATRNLVTSFPLLETVRNTDRPMDTFESLINEDESKQKIKYKISLGRNNLTKKIIEQAKPKLYKFGIELVDVKIKRINYIEGVRNAVYNRMVAERNQIAEKFRAEGRGEASNIIGQKEKDLQVIRSQAYRIAQEIKGDADALASNIYAKAYGADPNFYEFLQTLKVYKHTFDKNSTIILSTDSDLMRLLKKGL